MNEGIIITLKTCFAILLHFRHAPKALKQWSMLQASLPPTLLSRKSITEPRMPGMIISN